MALWVSTHGRTQGMVAWLWRLGGRLAVGLVVCCLVGSLEGGRVAAESPPAPTVPLTLKDTLLSAKLDQVPLGVVLAELARQADLTVYITEATAQKVISTTFTGLPLPEGIARILQGESYALITEPTGPASGKPQGQRLAKIRVLSQGDPYTTLTGRPEAPTASATSAAAAPTDDADLARWKREAVEAPEAAKRAAALTELDSKARYKKGGGLQSVVTAALKDAEPEVREIALGMLPSTVSESQALVTQLAAVAHTDASPALRIDALMTLAGTRDPAVVQHLHQALQDPDQQVSATAKQLLEFVTQRAGTAGGRPENSKPVAQPDKSPQ